MDLNVFWLNALLNNRFQEDTQSFYLANGEIYRSVFKDYVMDFSVRLAWLDKKILVWTTYLKDELQSIFPVFLGDAQKSIDAIETLKLLKKFDCSRLQEVETSDFLKANNGVYGLYKLNNEFCLYKLVAILNSVTAVRVAQFIAQHIKFAYPCLVDGELFWVCFNRASSKHYFLQALETKFYDFNFIGSPAFEETPTHPIMLFGKQFEIRLSNAEYWYFVAI